MSSEMHLFRDKKGTPVLTNRPEKYRGKKEYIEIAIKYEPISTPSRFRKYISPFQYSDANIAELVAEYSRRYVLDEKLVWAVIRAESNGNPNAVSPAGACGLMQLMPGTAMDMGIRTEADIFNPAKNIAGGTQYLAKMLNLFGNNTSLALAAYNSGPETVKKYGGIPPIPETQNYVRLVQQYAGMSARPIYVPADRKDIPLDGRFYWFRLKSGRSEPAEKYAEAGDTYWITYKNRLTPIRKDKVQDVTPPNKKLAEASFQQ
ncbi:MAG: lytic transglycosylase domain-containing protein [Candidatus Hydrogenedentes bacterium]|nr:lytic transglycosylase domain-containing protein [Candidatus Hydrogenedentota bacterium]